MSKYDDQRNAILQSMQASNPGASKTSKYATQRAGGSGTSKYADQREKLHNPVSTEEARNDYTSLIDTTDLTVKPRPTVPGATPAQNKLGIVQAQTNPFQTQPKVNPALKPSNPNVVAVTPVSHNPINALYQQVRGNPNGPTVELPSTGSKKLDKAAHFVGETSGQILQNPVGGTEQTIAKGLEYGAAKLLPKAAPVVTRTLANTATGAIENAAAGAGIGQTDTRQLAENAAIGGAFGGLGSLAGSAIGKGLQVLRDRRAAVSPEMDAATNKAFENVQAAPATPKKLGVAYGKLTPASNEQYINKVMGDIKSTVTERMTPPLENQKELAKWLQPHLGDASLNEIRQLSYEDMRQLAEEVRSHLSMYDMARQAAKERGYDLDQLLNNQTPSITKTADRLRMGRVAGAIEAPKGNVRIAVPKSEGKFPAPPIPKPPEAAAQEPVKQNWFTTLFGQRGLGISAGGTFGGKAVRSEDVIVRKKLLNDKQGIINGISAGARDLKHNHVDRYDSLKAFGPEVYETAMDSSRANNVANNIVGKHFVTPEGKVVGKGLQTIFKQVHRGYDKQFVDYLTLRHAETRIGRGERVYDDTIKDPNDPNRSMNTVEAVQDKLSRYNKQHKDWANIAKDWDTFNDNVLQHYGVAEGLISPGQYSAMRTENPFYASMMRQFSRSEKPSRKFIGSQTGAQFSGQKGPIKEVSPTGSGRKIIDTRKSAIEQVGAWANAAFRNRVMQGIVDKIKADPESFKGIAEIIKAPKQGDASLQQALSDPNHDYLNLLKNDFDGLFGKGKPSDDNVVRAMVNGEPVYIKVHNPEIVRSLASMSPQEAGIIVSTLQKFSNAVKTGATGALAPLFATRGVTVDVVQSLIQSKNPILHLPDLAHAILGSLNVPGLNKLAQEYERAGGKYSAALKGDRQLNKSLSKLERHAILSPQGVAKGVKTVIAAPFKAANRISDVAENVNRMAAYKGEMRRLGNVKSPENVRQAMSQAREITTNFSRRGAKSQELEALFPYNNAAIQGTRRILLGFKNPKTAIKTLAGITALSILPKAYEYAQFHDDPDYQKLTARERYRNNIVAKLPNGKFLKVPIEPAYGAFGEATIEAMRKYKDHDAAAFKGAADALANAYLPPMVTGAAQGLTQGTGIQGSLEGIENATSIAPVAAAINNKSFTGAPIVPMDVEGRTDKYEYDERTSAVAKKIGQYTGYSPMKVDYLLKAYGGDPARMILPVTSAVGGGNVRDTMLKNFVLDPTYSNNLTQDFYDAKDKLNSAYQDNKDLDVPFPSWYDEGIRKELSSTAKGSITKRVGALRDKKSEIQSDKTLSKKEKTDQLESIQKQINDIYLDINAKLSNQGIIK